VIIPVIRMVAWPAVVTFIPLLAALLLVAGRGGSPRPAAPSGPASPPAARTLDEAAVEHIPVAPAHWAACGNGLQCAGVDVPVDYTHPAGPRLRIAVARHPADDPAHRAGVLMFNPGGPAVSGIKARRLAADAFPADIRARFDIVTIDPRGAGGSSPLARGPAIATATATAARPVPPAAGPLPATVPYQALLDDCRRREGGLPPFISTANTVRDLDLVRRAAGASSVSFLGLSYGTLLGAQYARLFGDHPRAAILDGRPSSTARSTQPRKSSTRPPTRPRRPRRPSARCPPWPPSTPYANGWPARRCPRPGTATPPRSRKATWTWRR